MMVPAQPKIYHIVHIDLLSSIIADGYLWCDAEIGRRGLAGPSIGMQHIKQRRLHKCLTSYPNLHVGDCVPFYFCPRSIMLYLLHQGNHFHLSYFGGQGLIIHLEADLRASVMWASESNKRWVFTLSNAGANYLEDHRDLTQLDKINWKAVETNQWSGHGIPSSIKEGKQSEFLIEHSFPWHLVERIGVHSQLIYQRVMNALPLMGHRPQVEISKAWYY
jgi:hypothetical protein